MLTIAILGILLFAVMALHIHRLILDEEAVPVRNPARSTDRIGRSADS
jgi:hypothetical protein